MPDLGSELDKKLAEIVERHTFNYVLRADIAADGGEFAAKSHVRAAVRKAADAALEHDVSILTVRASVLQQSQAKADREGHPRHAARFGYAAQILLEVAAALRREKMK